MFRVRSSVGALLSQISALLRLRSYVGALMSTLLCRRSFDGVPPATIIGAIWLLEFRTGATIYSEIMQNRKNATKQLGLFTSAWLRRRADLQKSETLTICLWRSSLMSHKSHTLSSNRLPLNPSKTQ